jgi:transposase
VAAVDNRDLKGLEIAARMRIVWEDGAWTVPSQSGNGKYRVSLSEAKSSCTCPDFELSQKPCKHVLAAQFVMERDFGGKAVFVDTNVLPLKKTYTQNWPAYNKAQTEEKHRFQVLLCDLCDGVEEPARQGAGRPPTLTRDALFASVFKVYSTVSTRRFMCDLQDAHARGYVSKPLHYNSICHYLEDPEFTPLLCELITQSSLPLKAIETKFAVDSSGFSTSRFVRWFDEKYGITRQGHGWVKCHLICGVKTNIVTAVEIKGKDAGDSPQLPSLVKSTAQNFTIDEVSADKAYSSTENLETILELGGVPYIAFKSSTTGAKGGLWEKMFHYYSFCREDFLQHYHKRSNVESTFSMIKAKFRDHVRSKSDTAMLNEVLCKVLCHNICVVIQSQCELGIEARFWENKPCAEDPVIVPMI